MEGLDISASGARSSLNLRASTSASSKPKMGRVQHAKPPMSKPDHALGIPRPGSVPLLINNAALEVHSTPISLATRSLSARSSTNTVFSASKQTGSGGSMKKKRSRRQQHKHGADSLKSASESRITGASTTVQNHKLGKGKLGASLPHLGGSKGDPDDGVQPSPAAPKGFNIGLHLMEQHAEPLDCSSESLSPEIDQFLQDIDAALRSPPGLSSNHTHRHESKGVTSSASSHQEGSDGSCSGKPKKTHKPAIAANFAGALVTGSVHHEIRATPTQADVGRSILGVQMKPNYKQEAPSTDREAHEIDASQTQPAANETFYPDSKPVGSSSKPVVGDMRPIPIPPPEVAPDAQRTTAACKIQHWYRRVRERRFAEVHSMLQEKRLELNRSRADELQRLQSDAEMQEQREAERHQRRMAKMQAARKVAIESLQQRREEKRQWAERIAQEEIAILQASGKIKHPKTQRKHKRKQPPSQSKEGEEKEAGARGGTSVPDPVIDEFFEAGSSRQHPQSKPSQHQTREATKQLPPPQPPGSNSKSTYNGILETLKLLEEAPPPLKEGTSLANSTPTSYLSAQNLQKLTTPCSTTATATDTAVVQSAPLSETKMQSIFSYLDEMERADQDLLSQLSRSRSEARTRGLSTLGGTTSTKPQQQQELMSNAQGLSSELEAATVVASDVTATILAQRMELDDKNKTVEMLQKALAQQRELTVYHTREMEKEGQKRMELQREEYESAVQRHQCFIDQLIDDKKVLSERCEQLVTEMRELDIKYKHKIKTMEESYTAELAKTRQVAAAADKLRREKWRAEETQRIKEATVKSLEPEIQRIIAKGKAEIQRLKALHEAELLQSDERAGRRFVAQMEELRAQCAAEKEQACAHERELARQRYEKLAEQEELGYQQQRRKLYSEVQQEKDRLAERFHQQQASLEQTLRERREGAEKEVEELRNEHSRVLDQVSRRHSAELRDIQEKTSIEKQAWEENYMKKQAATMMMKEREMREALRQERDKEIEMVIRKLEEETASAKAECERASEARIRRIREKYEAELREVERSERTTLEKFNSVKTQLAELEGEGSRLRSLLRQKEQEVERVGEVASKLTKERDNVADIVRQEFADRLVTTEEDNKQLKIEMSELRARHRVELQRVGQAKEKEMGEVHERVKQALEKKEENLRALRVQHEAALKRAEHLEMLLERQRKELVKK